MKLQDVFKDILRHTHSLGLFENVKVIGTNENNETEIQTHSETKDLIVLGKMLSPVAEFNGLTFGLSRMNVLDGFLTMFDQDTDTVTLVRNANDNTDQTTPTEISFSRADGSNGFCRFMSEEMIDRQLSNIAFKGSDYDLTMKIPVATVKQLSQINSFLGSYYGYFSPETSDGKLYFSVGSASSDRTRVYVGESGDKEVNGTVSWPLDNLLRILKVGEIGETTIALNKKGLVKITVSTDISEFTYYLLAKTR